MCLGSLPLDRVGGALPLFTSYLESGYSEEYRYWTGAKPDSCYFVATPLDTPREWLTGVECY